MAALLALCGATWASAQQPPALPELPDSAAYARIEDQRRQEDSLYQAEQARCAERFAVNDCLKQAQVRHRAVEADLRRQEAVLHDMERQYKGADQQRQLEQRLQEKRQQALELEARQGAARTAEPASAPAAKRTLPTDSPSSAAAAPVSGPTAAEQAANRASYAAKQQQAERKRREIAQRQKDRAGKAAKPLPLPP